MSSFGYGSAAVFDDLNAPAHPLALEREALRLFQRAGDGAGKRSHEQGEYVVHKAVLPRAQERGVNVLEELLRTQLPRRALKEELLHVHIDVQAQQGKGAGKRRRDAAARGDHGVEQRKGHGEQVSARAFERIMEQVEKLVADLVDESEEQVVLILKILIKAAARDARGLHNAVDGRLSIRHGGKFAPRAL